MFGGDLKIVLSEQREKFVNVDGTSEAICRDGRMIAERCGSVCCSCEVVHPVERCASIEPSDQAIVTVPDNVDSSCQYARLG